MKKNARYLINGLNSVPPFDSCNSSCGKLYTIRPMMYNCTYVVGCNKCKYSAISSVPWRKNERSKHTQKIKIQNELIDTINSRSGIEAIIMINSSSFCFH